MHDLDDSGIQTSKRVQVYSGSLKLGKKINLEIWGSPGSRQLLRLQQFPKILKNLGPPLFLFELVSSLLVFSLLFFGLWIVKRLSGILVAIDRRVFSHLNDLSDPILSSFFLICKILQSFLVSVGISVDCPAVAGVSHILIFFFTPSLWVIFKSLLF